MPQYQNFALEIILASNNVNLVFEEILKICDRQVLLKKNEKHIICNEEIFLVK